MPNALVASVLQALSSATDVAVHQLDEQNFARMHELVSTDTLKIGQVRSVSSTWGRLMMTRYGKSPVAVIIAGPFAHADDDLGDVPILDSLSEDRLERALSETTVALSRIVEEQRRRVELASQLEVISSAVMTLTSDQELDPMLHRIVDLAQLVTSARYASIALSDSSGGIETFISSGISLEVKQHIGPQPRGLGILGVLLRDARPIRMMDLTTHPASIGFPSNHPYMTSFLGVPIVVRGHILGSLYLASKRLEPAFTEEDARLVQILARHAGVAIENARMFQRVSSYERRLREICFQIPEAVIVTETNPDRVSLTNQKATELLGWDIQPPLMFESFLSQIRWRFTDGTLMPMELTPLWRVMRQGELVRRYTCELIRPDGQAVRVIVNAGPLMTDDHDVSGAIMIFQDISERGDL